MSIMGSIRIASIVTVGVLLAGCGGVAEESPTQRIVGIGIGDPPSRVSGRFGTQLLEARKRRLCRVDCERPFVYEDISFLKDVDGWAIEVGWQRVNRAGRVNWIDARKVFARTEVPSAIAELSESWGGEPSSAGTIRDHIQGEGTRDYEYMFWGSPSRIEQLRQMVDAHNSSVEKASITTVKFDLRTANGFALVGTLAIYDVDANVLRVRILGPGSLATYQE